MAGEKSDSSTNPSAVRIRDNQRRSRARHKEYVEGLQTKLQEFERRGVEATLEMQQAARNVALENSRLRMLLGYHGVTADEVDKFLQTFPEQPATEIAKATISQPGGGQILIASAAPKIPIQPISRSSSTGPVNQGYGAPPVAKESTREVLDAIVGIKRETRMSDVSSSGLPQPAIPTEQRQPLLQPRPPGPTLPALILGQTRPDTNSVDRLSVLASASMQDPGDRNHRRVPSGVDSLHVPSPPAIGQSPPSSNAETPGRLNSASPRSQDRRSRSPFDKSPFETYSVARVISDIQGNTNHGSARAYLESEGRDNGHLKLSALPRIQDDQP
ncbi:hypothetical protein G7Z17_g7929 [Cylindrodendrum hubeiense]|uniref:BZIP domain-containing protein n=1 Tax=Cylindrodendrum hubeiense TaxID=595255 RepID=A0A9P5L6Z2_9HYPO|nr:hypothetical protein G7Z17_g7929 [Cylindrodendrum hubeiense]